MPETGAGVHLQDQLEILIQEFRTSEPPMPVFVVHAQDGADDETVAGLVQHVRDWLTGTAEESPDPALSPRPPSAAAKYC